MTALPDDAPEGLLTIDELAVAVGMTVRNTRYYASLGLMPAPIRRGRVAYYDEVHRARLELVRALQQHGFTLQAIEGFVGTIPADATVEQLALQRAMLTSWTPQPPEELTRRELEEKAGRELSADDLRLLLVLGSVERRGKSYVALPHLEVGLGLLDLDVPEESLNAAGEAIRRHMEALVEELTGILRTFAAAVPRAGRGPGEAERAARRCRSCASYPRRWSAASSRRPTGHRAPRVHADCPARPARAPSARPWRRDLDALSPVGPRLRRRSARRRAVLAGRGRARAQLTHSLTWATVAAGSSVAGETERLVMPASLKAAIRSLT